MALSVQTSWDAVVVGAGPNGLAAAIVLAQAGLRVVVFEANEQPGGGVRSFESTLPGVQHDFGAAVFPLGIGSPFFQRLPLHRYGLRWVHPEIPLAHPLDGGRAVFLFRSVKETGAQLGRDANAYRRLLQPLAEAWPRLGPEILQPFLHIPRHPWLLARFGIPALLPAKALANRFFRTEQARALWAGLAAHAALPLTAPGTSSFGLVLGALGHHVGWPIPEGGAGALTAALVNHLRTLGGEVITGARIHHLNDLPPARAVLMDVSPRALAAIAGDRLPNTYRDDLLRYPPGPGVFKVDYALDAPIPWTHPVCARAGTLHLGGTLEEIHQGEQAVAGGRVTSSPFVLAGQPNLFDPTRAPKGIHTLWAYCHVPNGDKTDMADAIEAQIERFAPGFQRHVRARQVFTPAQLQASNANLSGGDIFGGAQDLWHLLARPVFRSAPYRTPAQGLYLCSASTPPGGGVHGMCGYHAARTALRDLFP